MASLQTLCEYNGYLYALWKGMTGDERMFYSRFDGTHWTDQQPFAGSTSVGPSAATYGGRLFVAWKGQRDDQRLFWLQIDGERWYDQAPIGASFNSSHGPSLSAFGGRLYAAWKGMFDDQTIWSASTNNAGWTAPTPIPGAFSRVGPSLATLGDRLYAVWRGADTDQGLWYASTGDGHTWTAPAIIPNVGSSVGPSVTAANGRLYAGWKGFIGDEQLWWSSFDPATGKWAGQQKIPNAQSSVGPAMGTYRGTPYAMWKGPGMHQNLSYSANLALLHNIWLKAKPVPGNSGQDTPVNIGVPLQYQEMTEWCWVACAASIAHYYNPGSTVNQADMVTAIGRKQNGFGVADCAPTPAIFNNNPGLAGRFANAFNPAAELCLDNVGLPQLCHQTGGIGDALDAARVPFRWAKTATLAEIAKEVDNDRPVCVSIEWLDNSGSHYVIIAGVLNDQILILDPGAGPTVMAYEDFPARYGTGATLAGVAFTKRS